MWQVATRGSTGSSPPLVAIAWSVLGAFGGEYRWIGHGQHPVLLVGEPLFHLALTTWAKVRSWLMGDTADNIPFHMEGSFSRARQGRPGDRVLFV
jgi:hypothetical protein